jgi:hypothetical protein
MSLVLKKLSRPIYKITENTLLVFCSDIFVHYYYYRHNR